LVGVDPERQRLIRRAFRLEWLSVGWMAVEAAVASGIAAHSITAARVTAVLARGGLISPRGGNPAVRRRLVMSTRRATSARSIG
jgi:hypothetical protein